MKKEKKDTTIKTLGHGRRHLTRVRRFSMRRKARGEGDPSGYETRNKSPAGEVCGPIKNIPGFFVSTAAPLMGSTHQGTRTRVSRYIHSQLERGNLN